MAKKTETEVKSKAAKAPKTEKAAKKSKTTTKKTAADKTAARLFTKYKDEIVPKLMKELSYSNVMEVPKLQKIVVNVGVGEAAIDSKLLDEAVNTIQTITGQKASIRSAKKSVSNFKLREGMNIGAKVTLRRENMYEFLDRFISVALPRVRDFRGISDKSFDGRGNYTAGIKEQIIFPEIDVDKVNKIRGMDITFVTSAKTDKEAYELLLAFGLPFRKKEMN